MFNIFTFQNLKKPANFIFCLHCSGKNLQILFLLWGPQKLYNFTPTENGPWAIYSFFWPKGQCACQSQCVLLCLWTNVVGMLFLTSLSQYANGPCGSLYASLARGLASSGSTDLLRRHIKRYFVLHKKIYVLSIK